MRVASSSEEDVAEVSSEVGSCHAVTKCPDPKSCGSWSSYYTCGEACLPALACNGCPHPPDPEDPCEPNPQKGLRPVYEVALAYERGDWAAVTDQLPTLGLPESTLPDLYRAAVEWGYHAGQLEAAA